MRAWMTLSRKSSPMSPTGMIARVSAGDDAQGDLAAVDVAEESHRQRDRLDELEHELHEADEHRDEARADPDLELVDREELAEVAADAQLAEALDLEDRERHEGQADRDVDVARRRTELLQATDRRDQPDPVREAGCSTKKAKKIGTYGSAVGPASPTPKLLSDS